MWWQIVAMPSYFGIALAITDCRSPRTHDEPATIQSACDRAKRTTLKAAAGVIHRGYCSNAKMRFQSFFMLMTIHPFFFASS